MLMQRLKTVNEDGHILSNVSLRGCGERRIGVEINPERQQPPHKLKLSVKEYRHGTGIKGKRGRIEPFEAAHPTIMGVRRHEFAVRFREKTPEVVIAEI